MYVDSRSQFILLDIYVKMISGFLFVQNVEQPLKKSPEDKLDIDIGP